MKKPFGQKIWLKKISSMLALSVILSACANKPQIQEEVSDPYEDVNRVVYVFNDLLDTWFLRPAATLYRAFLPPPVQDGIHNVLANLSTPVILLNDVLQGEDKRAETTITRFAINSTVGFLGVNDAAKEYGYEKHSEDFGQTLATWGVGEGPYIVLPVFGPSNPRDAVGLVVDYFTDPINYWADNTDREGVTLARAGLGAVDRRARLFDAFEDIKKNSLDPYASLRSYYRQNRNSEILNNTVDVDAKAPSLSFDFNAPAPGDEEITEAR